MKLLIMQMKPLDTFFNQAPNRLSKRQKALLGIRCTTLQTTSSTVFL
jgi:hypothetical protein